MESLQIMDEFCSGPSEIFLNMAYIFMQVIRNASSRSQIRSSHPEVFCKKGVLRNVLKRRLWHRYFPVNFAKFPRTPFLTEHLRSPLLADVLQNRCSEKFRNFHRKTPMLESLFNKAAGLKAWNFIKK